MSIVNKYMFKYFPCALKFSNVTTSKSIFAFSLICRHGHSTSFLRQETSQGSHRQNRVLIPLTTALLAGIVIGVLNSSQSTECDDSSEHDRFFHKELVDILRKKLEPVRKRLIKKGKPTPELLVYTSSNRAGIKYELDVKCDIKSLIETLIPIINIPKDSANFELHKGYGKIYSNDRLSSIIWYRDIEGWTVTIEKHNGYTKQDIDILIKGYENVITSFDPKGKISQLDDHIFDIFKKFFPNMEFPPLSSFSNGLHNEDDNDNDLNPFHGNPYEDDDDNQRNMNPIFSNKSKTSSDPYQSLLSLGVRVYKDGVDISTSESTNDSTTLSSSSTTTNKSNNTTTTTTNNNNNNNNNNNANRKLTWDDLAGYNHIKELIEDTVINSYLHSEVYESIVKKTRVVYEPNHPTAILLEGPPGTGKTLTARILASQVNRPLIVIPITSITSKWYGDSEKKLTQIFDICENQIDGAIIFIDEMDGLVGNRDEGNMHEVTRRILSILLQKIEGFQGKSKCLMICATNRKEDLDAALLSRFNIMIHYDKPDALTRKEIMKRYAKQFTMNDKALENMVIASDHLSCRDIKESCEQVERKWASKMIRKEKGIGEVPTVEEYINSFQQRQMVIGNHNKRFHHDYDQVIA